MVDLLIVLIRPNVCFPHDAFLDHEKSLKLVESKYADSQIIVKNRYIAYFIFHVQSGKHATRGVTIFLSQPADV
jgi:hypothetical protein